jgi:ribonuclease HII
MTEQKLNPLDWDMAHLSQWGAWCGVDEAGRGAWAGPVVAAAVVLNEKVAKKWESVLRSARDSKTMKPAKREALALELKAILPAWAVSAIDSQAIDKVNILEATKAAMRQAIYELKTQPNFVLVDGDHAPKSGLKEMAMVEGDAYSCAIACASIIAKTHRDNLMIALEAEYLGYGFAKHKGYGTKQHQAALVRMGPCAIHRMSFAPIERYNEQGGNTI